MKLPLSWLREFIPLPWPESVDLEAFEERLTVGGLEIEEVIRSGPDLGALVVGHVVERVQHPNADRLSLCTVDVGQEDAVEIVCGAPNVAGGQKVAVALHGAVLPDGTKIKRSKIRNVRSNGMICSVSELGLGEDADGILVLDTEAAPGTALPEVLPPGEVVFDMGITPNRGDWVSLLGMAREVRAQFGGTVTLPETAPDEGDEPAQSAVAVEIEDTEGCFQYVARVVRGVRVGESPAWVRERLEAAGLRSINNVVDVTNLVMLELGQPLHAFDLAKLRGGVVRVRRGAAGEKFVTLDGQTRELGPDDVVIADGEGAIAIGGVMGGAESEVSAETCDVLIEAAQFDPSRIRKTARRLSLPTDASYRFERGVDPDGVGRAADRAARLLSELAGGTVSRGRVEANGALAPRCPEIRLDPVRIERLLGTAIPREEVIALLERVDVQVSPEGEALRCLPPGYRSDLWIPEDLIEEIARLYGYDRIEATLPEGALEGVAVPPERLLVDLVRDRLVEAGLIELMTFPAVRARDLDALRLPADDPRRSVAVLENPLQSEEALLRPTLAASLLRSAQLNLSRQLEGLRLFEVSRIFLAGEEGELPRQPRQAGAVFTELRGGGLWQADVPVFFSAKGVAEHVLRTLELGFSFHAGSDEPFLHPGASGEFRVGREVVAAVGELHPETAAAYELEVRTALLLLDLEALGGAARQIERYQEISRQPRVRRDLAILLDASTATGEVIDAIHKAAGSALSSVDVFDRYEGKGVPAGKVSVAYRLVFQRLDRTLTDSEVAKSIERVVNQLSKRFGAQLR